ncbi:hypothetical protein GOODEAATRI_025439 [Goodea atripinnis]|uniref:Uncharacterized protein n=1 Tax=Goodea atripinnis TaxID=208336 RepID=A0ABV0P7P1_9TELE
MLAPAMRSALVYLRRVLEGKSHRATVPSQAPASRRQESGASAQTRSALLPGCSNAERSSPGGDVRGAAEQVTAAGAEAAAVNPVDVARQRGEGKLREVRRVINPKSFIS